MNRGKSRSGGMADALDSKSSNRKVVGVQVPAPVFWVPDIWQVSDCVDLGYRQGSSLSGAEHDTFGDPSNRFGDRVSRCRQNSAFGTNI